jgi:Domain of unknown function (DUF6458)
MSIGVGLFLVAIGAILAFAVNDTSVGNLDVSAVGIILMVIGAVGTTISMLVWNKYQPTQRRARLIERELPGGRVVEREVPPGRIVEREAPAGRVIRVDSTPRDTERIVEQEVPPDPDARNGSVPPRRSRTW